MSQLCSTYVHFSGLPLSNVSWWVLKLQEDHVQYLHGRYDGQSRHWCCWRAWDQVKEKVMSDNRIYDEAKNKMCSRLEQVSPWYQRGLSDRKWFHVSEEVFLWWNEEDWEGWFSSWQELHEVQQTPASYSRGWRWWLMIDMKRLLRFHEFCDGDLWLTLTFGTCLMTLWVEWSIAMMHGHPLVDVDDAMVW